MDKQVLKQVLLDNAQLVEKKKQKKRPKALFPLYLVLCTLYFISPIGLVRRTYDHRGGYTMRR